MGNLPDLTVDPTLEAMRAVTEAEAAKESPRRYLGASSLGDRCERRLYYKLRMPQLRLARLA